MRLAGRPLTTFIYVRHNEADDLALVFARSALRHGISHERATYVIEHCRLPLYAVRQSDRKTLMAFLGPDWNGVPLEIGALELTHGDLLVIHAMRLRRTYVPDYERVMRWFDR